MTSGQRQRLVLAATGVLLAAVLWLPDRARAEDNIVISGRIASLGGEPVAGAEVYLYSSANTRKPADFISPKSSAAGTYRMVVPRAKYRAVARLKKGERYGPLMPGDRHSGEPVSITPDDEQAVTLDFTVADMQELAQRGTKGREDLAEIAGTISATGNSLPAVYVYARTGRLTATLPEYFSGWADANGRYRLKLPPGRYFLGLATEFPPAESAAELKEVTIAAGKLPVAIDLQLPLQ